MKLGLIGVGLIGGSMALKLKNKKAVSNIIGFDKNRQHLQIAKDIGIIDQLGELDNVIKNSDLIIIALPVEATANVLKNVLDKIIEKQVVMDVGSTKNQIIKGVQNHPMRKY